MQKTTKNLLMISVLTSLITGCTGFFDKDNTPPPSSLSTFRPELRIQPVWLVKTGSGVGKDYLRLVPAVTESEVITANKNGTVTATNQSNGKNIWTITTGADISAGPAAHDQLAYVASRQGEVIALDQTNGNLIWKAKATSEVLATPAIGSGVVVAKAIDGKLTAFSEKDGHVLWHYQQTEPALILRAASAPQISHETLVAGFANGNLAKLNLQGGSLQWQTTVAVPEGSFAIQRMVDIDADPIIFNNQIFVATYQGRIANINLATGKENWMQDLSSYTGMAVDERNVYVSDAKSQIWGFDAETGKVIWRQDQLQYRNVTGPAIMGPAIVVGDAEGYLHWLSKADGHLLARTKINSAAIIAAPVVKNNVLYAVTTNGYLAAYKIG